MTGPLVIDRFCGEGGAAAGYVRAGLRVWGVDDNPKLEARYLASGAERFVCADANTWEPDEEPVAEHYSPPCKDYTDLAARSGGDGTGWMLPHAVERAQRLGTPYVIENVEGAAALMSGAVTLCGTMFGLGVRVDGRRRHLKRHRLFLTSFPVMMIPPHACAGRRRLKVGVYGTGGGGQMTRGYKADLAQARVAMDMPWAGRDGVSQAIPPAYTELLGEQLLAYLGSVAA